MKKTLFFAILLSSVTAFAFGGGHSYNGSRWDQGVDKYGIHMGGKGQVDIDIRSCKTGETWTGAECCSDNRVLAGADGSLKCCAENQIVENGQCVLPLPLGSFRCGTGYCYAQEEIFCTDGSDLTETQTMQYFCQPNSNKKIFCCNNNETLCPTDKPVLLMDAQTGAAKGCTTCTASNEEIFVSIYNQIFCRLKGTSKLKTGDNEYSEMPF